MSRRLLFALLAMGIGQAAVYLIRPTTSYRLLAYGEGALQVGVVAAAFALLPIFLAIPLGRMSDRRGAPLLVIGCAVQTGVGAVLNTARVPEGATVLVAGAGGIGVSIVQGAQGTASTSSRASADLIPLSYSRSPPLDQSSGASLVSGLRSPYSVFRAPCSALDKPQPPVPRSPVPSPC